jgi:hypothetical protein
MSLTLPYGLPALTVFLASAAVSFQDFFWYVSYSSPRSPHADSLSRLRSCFISGFFFGMSHTLPHGLPTLTVFLASAAVSFQDFFWYVSYSSLRSPHADSLFRLRSCLIAVTFFTLRYTALSYRDFFWYVSYSSLRSPHADSLFRLRSCLISGIVLVCLLLFPTVSPR